jgi:hypothetical protein
MMYPAVLVFSLLPGNRNKIKEKRRKKQRRTTG